jgi:hypothetical protein
MTQPPQASEAERAIAIRDHLMPLIETTSAAHEMSGTPALLFMTDGFTIGYRKMSDRRRLEVRKRILLLRIEWTDAGTRVVTFRPGDWERTIMALREM